MFGVTDMGAYIAALAVVIVLPGPNSMYVLSTAARLGIRTGYKAALGVLVGDSVLMAASATGLASMLQAAPALYTGIRLAGAAYLAYLGLSLLRSAVRRWRRGPEPESDTPEPQVGVERPFRRALTASLLNPKAIVFFVAFYAQFVDPTYAYPALGFGLLALIGQAFSVTWLSTLILTGDRLAAAFRRSRRLAAAGTGAAGAAMAGFAARLAAG